MTFTTAKIRHARQQPVIAVIGATASGKSVLAMELAERLSAELLCVDSMTVYRDMDIGTAKPTTEDRAKIVHHGLDLVAPTETFTVARFVEMADGVIADCATRGKRLIAVGGTPLYYKVLFEGLFEGPAADEDFRARAVQRPVEELYGELQKVDPVSAGRFHANDIKRVVRALEVYHLTGMPISQHQTQWNTEPRHPVVWVGIRWEKELLNRRINSRAKVMVEAGWLEETRKLLDRYGDLGPTAGEAAGYDWLAKHIHGKVPLDEAIEQIKISTRQLARRQMKWFRRFEGVIWVEGADLAADAAGVAAELVSRFAAPA